MEETRRSIDIVLVENHTKTNGTLIGVVTKEVVNELHEVINRNDKYEREAEKLKVKNEQALRAANKFMKRVITSHGVKLDHELTDSIGIAKDDTIYIAPIERLREAPDADPQEGDAIVGKLLKYERRKYNELLAHYDFLKKRIEEHNKKVFENEEKLAEFEQQLLVGAEYTPKVDFLAVYPNGRVILCTGEKGE